MNCLVNPFECYDEDWSSSFDRLGWSTCGKDNYFIKAFHRNDPHPKEDPISLLNKVRCCSATFVFNGARGECAGAYWKYERQFGGSVHLKVRTYSKTTVPNWV